MGFKLLEIKLPTDFTNDDLLRKIKKKLHISECSYSIERQSLDARKKNNIHWNIRVCVTSKAISGTEAPQEDKLEIPYKKRDKKIIVVGSGPAGFFSAYTLLLAGFSITILEQGNDVERRLKDISAFEQTGVLNEQSNYSFGEGGAGTFSDGKLTSRSKRISLERKFVIDSYIEAGAPDEISYLTHPHLGSDNLKKIVINLRKDFINRGGEILFGSKVKDIYLADSKINAVETSKGKMEADYFIFATGHSAYKTYRALISKGIPFRVKPFAIGCRVEHYQELINLAQWNKKALAGVKAAEYKLTYKDTKHLPVYSFCICPGGKVVPAAPYKGLNIVNGMSDYKRNSPYANSAIVAGFNLNKYLKKELEPLEAVDWLKRLEQKFYDFSESYAAPAVNISDFLTDKISASFSKSSYPFDLIAADFKDLLPDSIYASLKAGMNNFRKKIKGFDKGIMLGLESKTSSPIQAVRDKNGRSAGINNLYITGEGSGYAGGIVSSAADGIKAALDIIG